jgi:hypothetical protein
MKEVELTPVQVTKLGFLRLRCSGLLRLNLQDAGDGTAEKGAVLAQHDAQ